MKEKGLVPKRRFGEFSTNEWQKYKFDELISRTSISSNEKHLPRVEYDDIISTRGVLNKDFSRKTSNKKGIEFLHGDILFGKLRPYLMNWLLADFNGIAVGDWWVFRSKSANTKFVYALIQNKRFQQIANLSTGTKMPRSDWSTVSQQTYYVPSSQLEQRQIGVFFEKIDRLIELCEHKFSKLKNLKQSYLHKMFPQKGSDVPEMRFAGFKDNWQKNNLGELTDIGTGASDLKDAVDEGVYPFFVRSENVERSNRYLFNGEAILIPGEGRLGDIFHYYNGKFDYHQRVYRISGFEESDAKGLFILFLMQSQFKEHAFKYTVKATVDSLRLPTLEEFLVMLPVIEEQKLIGNFFKKLDDQINAQERKLDKLRQMKKAYLEEMFV